MAWVLRTSKSGMGRFETVEVKPTRTVAQDFFAKSIENRDELAEILAAQIDDPIWKLELTKSIMQRRAVLVAQAQTLESADPDSAIETETPKALVKMTQFLSGRREMGFLAYAALVWVTLIATVLWLWCLIRFGRDSGSGALTANTTAFAVHGEDTTRTRHVLKVGREADAEVNFVILGRPRLKLSEVRAQLGLSTETELLRPISWRAGLTSMPKAVLHIFGQAQVTSVLLALLPLRERVAICFRIFLGACHARWWAGQKQVPASVVFGHTGLADTSQLEVAMQGSGVKTVHAFHGVSVGWNFTGISDLAICKCGHDTKWHTGLFGYGSTFSLPCPKPAPKPIDRKRGWMVFSNYMHPSHDSFPKNSAAAEIRLIDTVAQAAEILQISQKDVHWVFHPAHKALPTGMMAPVLKAISDTGFTVSEPASLGDAAKGLVLTTPSTIALDMLRMGRVPIIVSSFPFAQNSFVGGFEPIAATADALGEAVKSMTSAQGHMVAFDTVWDRVKPAGALTPESWLTALERKS